MPLRTVGGARKYLTAGERQAVLRAAEQTDDALRTLCMTLAYAGCRLPEPLALTAERADLATGVLVIESLKKRRGGIHRAMPVPPALPDALDLVDGIRELQTGRGKGRGVRLSPWSRMTAGAPSMPSCSPPARTGHRPPPKARATAAGSPLSPPASPSTPSRHSSATPNSPRQRSMPTPSGPRNTTLPARSGVKRHSNLPCRVVLKNPSRRVISSHESGICL